MGDVRTWLEATGTEPNGIIGLHVWDEMSERSQLAAEMHTRLVSHLEERLAAGEIDPDLLAVADPAACHAHLELQERWMTSALPDGRVPMDVLLDEKDEEFLAEWDDADAKALAAIQALLDRVGDRPLPREDLRRAAPGFARTSPGRAGPALLIECSGLRPRSCRPTTPNCGSGWPRAWRPRRDRRKGRPGPGRRIPMRWKANSPLSAPSTISTGWRRSPRSPRAARARRRPPPTWLATCATRIRRTPRTQTTAGSATSRATRTSPTAQISVGGPTALIKDFDDRVSRNRTAGVRFVSVIAFVMLLISIRSVFLALKGVLMTVLSVAAAYGSLVMIFQWGWLETLGFEPLTRSTAPSRRWCWR